MTRGRDSISSILLWVMHSRRSDCRCDFRGKGLPAFPGGAIAAGGALCTSFALALLLLSANPLAESVVTREEALDAAFPGAEFRGERIFLTEEQRARAAQIAGEDIPSALVARYLAFQGGEEVGRAYIDTHVVRTKKETLLICLSPDGALKRIEITAFLEPPEYIASPSWYGQYEGKGLSPELRLQRGIQPIAGATLTALATNQAVRRILAIDQILREEQSR